MADMNSIINEIKGLDEYTKAMRTVYEQKGLREDLDNLLMHINNLKACAGLNDDAGENTLPIQRVINSFPGDVPLFVDWLDKYYTHAGNDDLYKRKDNGTIETQSKLYKDYKRAYKLGNDC